MSNEESPIKKWSKAVPGEVPPQIRVEDIPKGWRTVEELIRDGYQPTSIDTKKYIDEKTAIRAGFSTPLYMFEDRAITGIEDADRKRADKVLADKGLAGIEDIEEIAKVNRAVGRDCKMAEAHVRDHLICRAGDKYYVSPDAVALLEQEGKIKRNWVGREAARDARPAEAKPGKPEGFTRD